MIVAFFQHSYAVDEYGHWVTSSKGGNVTPNYFSNIEYTNATDRKIYLALTTDTSDERLKELYIKYRIQFTIKTVGQIFFYEEIHPLSYLAGTKTFEIRLNDGRLDDYKTCIWFDKYDGKAKCVSYNQDQNETIQALDVTDELLYVVKDIEEEGGIEIQERYE